MMTMNKFQAACIASVIMAVLSLASCGLKDDLYIPAGETEAAPADSQNAEAPDENQAERDTDNSEPSPEQAP